MTLVSFVLPLYNGSATLPGCLHHLLAQRRAAWECVAVNDASPDDSAAVFECHARRDPRLWLLHHDRNQGVAAARNTGLRAARGEFVHFLDQDDHLHPDAARGLVAALARRPDAVASYGDYEMVQTVTGERRFMEMQRPQLNFGDFARGSPFTPLAVLHRRAAVLDSGGLAAGVDGCDDWDLWGRLTRTGAVFVHAGVCVGEYRIGGGNQSLRVLALFRAGLRVIEQLYQPDSRVLAPAPKWAGGGLPECRERILLWFLWAQVGKALLTRRGDLALELTDAFVAQCGAELLAVESVRLMSSALMHAAWFAGVDGRTCVPRFADEFGRYFSAVEGRLGRDGFGPAALAALWAVTVEDLANENRELAAQLENYKTSRSYRVGRSLTRTLRWFLPR